ncbi:hypothetical protein [Peijinzhouia sedimentorum]
MARPTYGCIKIEMASFDPSDGTNGAFTAVPVYRDTIVIVDGEPTVSNHFQQGKKNPAVSRMSPTPTEISFQLLHTDPDALAAAMGGTVTTVEGVKSWAPPKQRYQLVKGVRFTFEDGSTLTVPAYSHFARMNNTVTEANINLIDVSGIVLDPGDEVEDMVWTDPPAPVVTP